MLTMINDPDYTNKSNDSKESLYQVTKQWINKIICKPPFGEGKDAYIIDTNTGDKIKYIEADCNQLRHDITNYEQLLIRIKEQYQEELYREAILNTIKYEATRRAFKLQHKWIQEVYRQEILEIKSQNFSQQMADELKSLETEIKKQKEVIKAREQELNEIRKDSKTKAVGAYEELQIKYKQLQKELEKEKKRREELGKNNQRLGAYKAHYNKAKKRIEELEAENKRLRDKIQFLSHELVQ